MPDFDPRNAKETLNRWIAHETAKAAREVTAAIEAYRFNEAAGAVYRFVWNIFCDWYLELVKPVLTAPTAPAKAETRAMVAWVLDQILKLLHPFMPFITEELWWAASIEPDQQRPKREPRHARAHAWPRMGLDDDKAEAEIGWVVDLITAIRSLRAEMNIPPATLMPLVLVGVSTETQGARRALAGIREAAGARVGDRVRRPRCRKARCSLLVRGEVAAFAAERRDRSRRRTRAAGEGNGQGRRRHQARRCQAEQSEFVANAAEEVVDGEKEKREEARRPPRQNPGSAGAAEGRGVGHALCSPAVSRWASWRRLRWLRF